MTWLQLDDRLLEHPKFIRAINAAGSAAVHLWLGLRAYVAQNLTDGYIPADMLDEVRGPKGRDRERALQSLRGARLVHDRGERDACAGCNCAEPIGDADGLWLHDFLDWSSSCDEVEKRRAGARERKQRSRGQSQPVSHRDGHRDDSSDGPRDSARSPRVVTDPRARDPIQASPSQAKPSQADADADADARRAEPDAAAAARTPSNLTEALEIPIAQRAQLVIDNPTIAAWVSPHLWPEIQSVAQALADATGKPAHARLANYHQDAGVKVVVVLFAAGYGESELTGAIANVVKSEWWIKFPKGLSALTPEVVRRALTAGDGQPHVNPLVQARQEARQKQRQTEEQHEKAAHNRRAAESLRARGIDPTSAGPGTFKKFIKGIG